MKKGIKNIGLILVTFIVCIGLSMVLSKKKTIETVAKHLSNNEVQYHFLSFYNEYIKNDMNCSSYHLDIQNFDELEENSSYIVKVKALKQSYILSNFITKVEVLESYKGQMNQKEINIFHPGIILDYEDHTGITLPQTWLLPMKEDEEYLLYLNKEESYGRDDLFQYTTIPYSLIPVASTIHIGLLDNQSQTSVTLKQDQVQGLDLCFPVSTSFTTMEGNEMDNGFVKDNYLEIISQSYQKYFQQEPQYDEKVIQSEL